MHSDLHGSDQYYVKKLRAYLSTVSVPKYGNINSYTKGVALFVPDWENIPDADIPKRYVVGINGESDNVAKWCYKEAEELHKKDAELFLLTRVEYNNYFNEKTEGTLYMVLSKGSCRSCRRVITKIFQKYYKDIRVVIWYTQEAKQVAGLHGVMYGFDKAGKSKEGFAVVSEAYSVQTMAPPA
ncbi:MAG: hypothetical protein V4488_07145 [Pseudomonadota bacterium]